VLHDVSFEVAPGERVAVVGATGSGKTTLLKLLTRLYDPQAGAIQLDGRPLGTYALTELRRRVGIVPQDVFLFGGDVLENVRLGHPEVSDDEALAAARRLGLDAVVGRFPRGFREPVRERGGNLSSGERQLIAFARVLAVAPPVLALDEATSNVDTETEALLQRAVHELTHGRTALVIAHRLSTIRDVDRILVLDRGRVVEEGTHEDLLARRGAYWKLVQLQFREAPADDAAAAAGPARQ
jgi:ABC-type multidrug transport system fused ATPase/permease subunit